MTLVIKLRNDAQNPCIHVAIAQQILIGHTVMYQGKYLQCKMPIEHRVLFTIYPEKKILQKSTGSVEKKTNQIPKMSWLKKQI